MSKAKKIRNSYKVALGAAAVAVISSVVSFVFVLLPVYDLVGENQEATSEANAKLDAIETKSDVTLVVTGAAAIVAVGAGGYGAYQDVRKKSKK